MCPRGTGASTLRFWESLEAGAIPVLFADEMQLPPGFDWDTCVIRIKEKNVAHVEKVLRSISKEKEEEMHRACLQAYDLFSGDNFVKVIRDYYR